MSGYSAPRPLSERDVVADFDSGEPTLDEYLRGRALAWSPSSPRCPGWQLAKDEALRGIPLLLTPESTIADQKCLCPNRFTRRLICRLRLRHRD